MPDSSFTFTPPEGAKQVTEFQSAIKGVNADLTGKPAPDFKLQSVAGKRSQLGRSQRQIRPAGFLGNLVRAVPSRSAGDRKNSSGISSQRPDRDRNRRGRRFGNGRPIPVDVEVELSHPADADSAVLPSYNVTAFPTVVLIDAEGKIMFYHVGAGGEKALRESLAKLGLETEPAH